MTYTNKFIEFLNGQNTIIIDGVKAFNSFKALCKRVGLDCFSNLAFEGEKECYYYDLLHFAEINNCAINNSTILVEYQPNKGLTFGYKTFEESRKWYEQNPWSIDEVKSSMR